MQIYFARGRDHQNQMFSFIVQAKSEETALKLIRDELKQVPILFWCEAVGDAFKGETDEHIVY